MFHKALFVGAILCFIGMGGLFNNFSQSSDLLKRYQKFGLVQSDLKFQKVEKAWGDQGLIFYQVQFPFIKVPITSDKMTLSLSDVGMNLKLKNSKINVTEGLKGLYGTQAENNLNEYAPYNDFLGKILTSMAVLGIDEFVGDILLNTTYSDLRTMNFDIQINQNKKANLKITGTIHLPLIGSRQLADLWQGQVEKLEIQIQNKTKLKQYIDYAKSLKIQMPESLKKGVISIKNLSRKLPHPSKILK